MTLTKLQQAFDNFLVEDAKFTSGNAAAGTRARNELSAISKLVKERRAEITTEKNARKEAKAV